MTCSLFVLFCIVGGVEFSPGLYRLELFNRLTGEIQEVYIPIKNDIIF